MTIKERKELIRVMQKEFRIKEREQRHCPIFGIPFTQIEDVIKQTEILDWLDLRISRQLNDIDLNRLVQINHIISQIMLNTHCTFNEFVKVYVTTIK